MNEIDKKINKDLILREKLALQRTELANQSTLLAFIRTSLYFLLAGLGLRSLLKPENNLIIEVSLFLISFFVLIIGVINYYNQLKKIKISEKHIGDYKLEFLNK